MQCRKKSSYLYFWCIVTSSFSPFICKFFVANRFCEFYNVNYWDWSNSFWQIFKISIGGTRNEKYLDVARTFFIKIINFYMSTPMEMNTTFYCGKIFFYHHKFKLILSCKWSKSFKPKHQTGRTVVGFQFDNNGFCPYQDNLLICNKTIWWCFDFI